MAISRLYRIGSVSACPEEAAFSLAIIQHVMDHCKAVGVMPIIYDLGRHEGHPIYQIKCRCSPEDAEVARAIFRREIIQAEAFRTVDDDLMASAIG